MKLFIKKILKSRVALYQSKQPAIDAGYSLADYILRFLLLIVVVLLFWWLGVRKK